MKKFYLALFFILGTIVSYAQGAPFITTWENTPSQLNGFTVEFITSPGYDYDFSIDFGDGTIVNNVTDNIFHTYATSGTYTVSISGDFPVFNIPLSDDLELKSIEQ